MSDMQGPASGEDGHTEKMAVVTSAGVVYVATIKGRSFKIGMTNGNPWARIAALQCGNPERMWLLMASELGDGPTASDFEYALHRALKLHRLVGEWFQISLDELMMIWKRIYLQECGGSQIKYERARDYWKTGMEFRD